MAVKNMQNKLQRLEQVELENKALRDELSDKEQQIAILTLLETMHKDAVDQLIALNRKSVNSFMWYTLGMVIMRLLVILL